MTKTIRLSEWVTPGDTAIPGMTSLEDGDLQHSSALAQSPKGDIEPNHPSEINPNSDSRSRSDGQSRRFVQYRVDQSQGQRPGSLLLIFAQSSFQFSYKHYNYLYIDEVSSKNEDAKPKLCF